MFKAIVVGAGGISRAWFPRLVEEGINIVAVVDLNREAAAAKIEEYQLDQAAAYDDLNQALADRDSDFVVDLTVPPAHCEVVCAALAAGRHVIGEKPMATSLDEARRMVAASEQHDRLYMVSQSRRYEPKLQAIATAVAEGRIGTVTDIVCQFYLGAHFGGFRAAMDHVLLGDMSIHHFDLARMFTGLDPRSVYCEDYTPTGSWFRDGPAAMAVYRMSNDARFGYLGSWCSEGRHTSWHGDWRIVGTEGSITFEGDGPVMLHRPVGEKFVREYESAEIPPAEMAAKGQHGALREFLAYLRDGTMPQGACDDNIQSFAMQTAAIESAETGKRVEIAV